MREGCKLRELRLLQELGEGGQLWLGEDILCTGICDWLQLRWLEFGEEREGNWGLEKTLVKWAYVTQVISSCDSILVRLKEGLSTQNQKYSVVTSSYSGNERMVCYIFWCLGLIPRNLMNENPVVLWLVAFVHASSFYQIIVFSPEVHSFYFLDPSFLLSTAHKLNNFLLPLPVKGTSPWTEGFMNLFLNTYLLWISYHIWVV